MVFEETPRPRERIRHHLLLTVNEL